MAIRCGKCGRPLYNRRRGKCEMCGAPIQPDQVLSQPQLSKLDRMREDESKRHREFKETWLRNPEPQIPPIPGDGF